MFGFMGSHNYRKSLKETRGSYSFFDASNAGLIQGRVSFIHLELYCGSHSRAGLFQGFTVYEHSKTLISANLLLTQ